MSDLFKSAPVGAEDYSAQHIEVLEGLEPVRRRPGMYIGGTDDRALHHLVAEVLDNAMDEAVAGHARRIILQVIDATTIEIEDDGRGIPVDPHPKHPDKSALEVIFTMLHSGGKFGGDAYKTSGGLHGVGVSVVNALSSRLDVEIARGGALWRQSYSRGHALGPLQSAGAAKKGRRGTKVRFVPDPDIFGAEARFDPARLRRMARSKAYLFKGVQIEWRCAADLAAAAGVATEEILHFPGGLADHLAAELGDRPCWTPQAFVGEAGFAGTEGRVEWAVAWPQDEDGFVSTYCNTVPTPQGGTHEAGLRSALLRAIKSYAELSGHKRAGQATAEDVMAGACVLLSAFIREPQFQGQTKEKLVTAEAAKLVDNAVKDHFDHFLTADPVGAKALLDAVADRAEERLKKREKKDLDRKTATRRLRLPGKLADCARSTPEGTEIFLVEGDSAGGSAKQARDRETQAVLPLRGKILNVASATAEKLRQNQELQDLTLALGCGLGDRYDDAKLRYERVVIMTDADVDGAHIASLLMTFFYREAPKLIESGRLFLAQPPLYRLTQGDRSIYARDDRERDRLLSKGLGGKGKIDISRFKGLGEMPPAQLRDTTMHPSKRTLLRVTTPKAAEAAKRTASLVESLMGRKPELRFAFIQENARFARDLDV